MLWIVVGALVTGLFHFSVWWRFLRSARLPRKVHWALTTLMIVMWLAIPITTRALSADAAKSVAWITMPWMALVGLLFVASIVLHLAHGLTWLGRTALRRPPPSETDLSRRLFLRRVTSGAVVTVTSAGVARGVMQARDVHEVVDVEVTLAKLPKALDGFSIVQLSDLHVGLTVDREFVQRIVDLTNRLSPDLIALTGDLVDGPVNDLADDIAPLASLRAKHGVFAITGNHEYYAGVGPWIEHITSLGARYLCNELVTIGEGTAAFDLAGVNDHSGYRYRHAENLELATAKRDPSRALVLLAHQPRQVRRAAKYGVDLQLSGHTHGGQVWPWHYLVKIQQGGLLAGRYQERDTQLYVTRGCGYWGPPVRLFAPLEITRVILRSA